MPFVPVDPASDRAMTVRRANARCATMAAMRPLNRLPPTTLFTHNDLGPRLIVLTHHKAISGPYHRNEEAILAVHRAFRGTPEQFRAIAKRHGATHLLACPNMAETTVYRARAPGGFYDQLATGTRFDWLHPVPLPDGSPLRLYRID